MNKIYLLFLFLILPASADAVDIFNTAGSFDIARAVKLGRGKAYSGSTFSNVITGGEISRKKNCSAGCSDCDTTTGTCNACSRGYYNAGGTCVACSTIPISDGTCTYCTGDEDYVSCEAAQCDTGYWDEYGTCETCEYAIDNCEECNSTGSTCTKCFSGYTLADDGKSCFNSSVTVKRYHRYNGSKIFYSSTTISRDDISSYYDSWPDVDIYDEDGGSVTQTTDNIAMVCASGTGEFWTMSACQQYKSAGYYCTESGYPSCPFEAQPCMIANCAECDPEGLCSTCESGYSLQNGTCEKTLNCLPGYGVANNSCTPCPAGKYSTGGSGACLPCVERTYSLGQAQGCDSVTLVPFCATYSTTKDACVACQPGYKLNITTGKCVSLSFTPDSGTCPSNLQDCGSTGCCPTSNSCSYYAQQAASGRGYQCLLTAEY